MSDAYDDYQNLVEDRNQLREHNDSLQSQLAAANELLTLERAYSAESDARSAGYASKCGTLRTELMAANERADAAVKALEDARGQKPVAIVLDGFDFIENGCTQRFITLVNPFPPGTELYERAAPVPAQPAARDDARGVDIERTALLAEKVAGKETADKIRGEIVMRDDCECPMCKRYNHVS